MSFPCNRMSLTAVDAARLYCSGSLPPADVGTIRYCLRLLSYIPGDHCFRSKYYFIRSRTFGQDIFLKDITDIINDFDEHDDFVRAVEWSSEHVLYPPTQWFVDSDGMYTQEAVHKIPVEEDPDTQVLLRTCNDFVGHSVKVCALFSYDESLTETVNCNAVGNILESVFINSLRSVIPSITNGPKQDPPDFFNQSAFRYEIKCFLAENFDVSSFTAMTNQLSECNGVFKKLFKTKYLAFRYAIENSTSIRITNFYTVRLWELINYRGKYPVSIQNKNGTWVNIRPSPATKWNDNNKTPKLFIDSFLRALTMCPNDLRNRTQACESIARQFKSIESFYQIAL